MRFMKVDLPEPEGPIIATSSPGFTWSETPRSACTTTSWPKRYSFWMSVTSTIGCVDGSTSEPERTASTAMLERCLQRLAESVDGRCRRVNAVRGQACSVHGAQGAH